ncbi:MAG: FixH family protein [Pseudomonadales bacterium]
MMVDIPWYKQGWPWAIICIPLSAVVFGIVMVAAVTQNPDDLVADDYYKEGMAINERLARDNNAARLGIVGRMMKSDSQSLQFEFSGATDSAVVLQLHHVVDRGKDRQVILYPEDKPGLYSTSDADVTELFNKKGVWYLAFEGVDDNWRLQTRVQLPVEELEVGH